MEEEEDRGAASAYISMPTWRSCATRPASDPTWGGEMEVITGRDYIGVVRISTVEAKWHAP
jgi:hypothetical protein